MQILTTPINKVSLRKLKAGEKIYVSGDIFTARDKVHKLLIEMLNNNQKLPFNLESNIIYYCGPSPSPPGKIIGSAGPTTSSRMDKYTPKLLDTGLKCMIGKGPRNNEVIDSIKRHRAVYLITIGGAAAYLSKKITACEVVAFPELGAEAVYRLTVDKLPCYVGIDSHGNNIFKK